MGDILFSSITLHQLNGYLKIKTKIPGKKPEQARNIPKHSWNTLGTPSEHPWNTFRTPGIPRNTPLTGQTQTQADGPWGIYNFLINIFYPIWCLPCSRSITHKIHLFWFCLVFFVFDILSLIKKYIYIFFVLVFHIDFSGNLWFPKFIIALDFSNGVFDF